MAIEDDNYNGYKIFTSAEYDGILNRWNGRYRILDKDGIVVYESFASPLEEEGKAQNAAESEARAWIDGNSAKP